MFFAIHDMYTTVELSVFKYDKVVVVPLLFSAVGVLVVELVGVSVEELVVESVIELEPV